MDSGKVRAPDTIQRFHIVVTVTAAGSLVRSIAIA